jgi:hypothetical protein
MALKWQTRTSNKHGLGPTKGPKNLPPAAGPGSPERIFGNWLQELLKAAEDGNTQDVNDVTTELQRLYREALGTQPENRAAVSAC